MRAAVPLALALLLAGCGKGVDPAEKARRDAADVAFVEAAQKQRAPAQPIVLQPLLAKDRARLSAGEDTCGLLLRDRTADDPIAVLGPVAGHIKLEGKLVVLAADTGSQKLPSGVYRRYDGKSYAVELGTGEGMSGWMTIKDSPGRTVFMAAGDWACAAD